MFKYVIPVMGLAMLGFGILHVLTNRYAWSKDRPPVEPPSTPFTQTLAGAGVIEAQTQNIAVGAPLPGVVVEVLVQVGQRVPAGAALFRLDDRHLQAELSVQQAAGEQARAELERLENQPRKEEIPIHEARVREAEANLAIEHYEWQRIQDLFNRHAAEEAELERRRQAHRAADAQLARARAELELLQAGSWEADRAVSRAAVAQAQARVEQVRTELDRLVVRTFVEGEVLQVNVRPGEFVGAPAGLPLVVLGNIEQLHARVDIDEYDIPRFKPGAPAVAMLRGSPQEEFPLQFVRVEPFVIPKRSLTGDITERVDTRVLQVIYAIDARGQQLYVGQQVDVFVDLGATAGGAREN